MTRTRTQKSWKISSVAKGLNSMKSRSSLTSKSPSRPERLREPRLVHRLRPLVCKSESAQIPPDVGVRVVRVGPLCERHIERTATVCDVSNGSTVYGGSLVRVRRSLAGVVSSPVTEPGGYCRAHRPTAVVSQDGPHTLLRATSNGRCRPAVTSLFAKHVQVVSYQVDDHVQLGLVLAQAWNALAVASMSGSGCRPLVPLMEQRQDRHPLEGAMLAEHEQRGPNLAGPVGGSLARSLRYVSHGSVGHRDERPVSYRLGSSHLLTSIPESDSLAQAFV